MLNHDPKYLLDLIAQAREERDRKLQGVDESLARYVGPDRAGPTARSRSPQNVEFEFVSYMSSQLAFDRPIISVESPIVSKQNDVLALEMAMNRWIRDTKVRQVFAQGVPDFCFAWTVYVVSERPAPELGEVEFKDKNGKTMRGLANRPYLKRLPFRTAFRDPLAVSPWDMRFAGNDEVLDKDSQIKEAEENPDGGWYLDRIRDLPVDSDLRLVGRKPSTMSVSRNEIVRTILWSADAEIDWETECLDDDGSPCPEDERGLYHGKIFTLGLTNDGAIELRKPQPFFGPRWGPYTFIGAHVVPDDPFFLSPIQPMRSAINQFNRVNDTADLAMENYKRLFLVNDLDEDLADKIRNGKHDHVFELPGYEKGSAEAFEVGGVSNQMQAHLMMMAEKVDRGLGMSDVMRGAISGDGSATEVALATQASSARMAAMERNWTYGHSQALLGAAWYFWHDDRVAQPISVQESMQLGTEFQDMISKDESGQDVIVKGKPVIEQQVVRGGTQENQRYHADSFDSLDLEILPYSMRFLGQQEAQARATILTNLYTNVVPLVPLNPHANWPLFERAMEKYTGIRECRNMLDLGTAAQMAMSSAFAQQAERAGSDGPRMAGDSGAKGKGQQQAPGQRAPMQLTQGQGGGANAAKPQASGMPGRSEGGKQGNKAKAGAA